MKTANLFLSYDMIEELYTLGVLRKLDVLFARFIAREDSSAYSQEIGILAGLVSYTTTFQENICLRLDNPVAVLQQENIVFASIAERKKFVSICADIALLLHECNFEEVFKTSKVVAVDPVYEKVAYPLVCSAGRLYLQRYWRAETLVVREIKRRADSGVRVLPVEYGRQLMLQEIYTRFKDAEKTYWQQLAVFAALSGRLIFITGGPGTGKTTVVSVIVALLLSVDIDTRIALVAPTGKAQARLQEAVLEEIPYLKISQDVEEQMRSLTFMTLHRLLGLGRKNYAEVQKLNYDLIIVDEASMISILLYERLFKSLRSESKLIFLGDREQLAAVEGGAVLSDICQSAGELTHFTADFITEFSRVMPEGLSEPEKAANENVLSDIIVPLEYTFRFRADSGIGRMKDLLTSGNNKEFAAFLDYGSKKYASSFALHSFKTSFAGGIRNELLRFLENWENNGESFFSYLQSSNLVEAYKKFKRFQIITALNSGVSGVEGINNMVTAYLGLQRGRQQGLPVMVTRNDYQTGLFNGDIGMYWEDEQGEMKVWFPCFRGDEVEFKSFLPAQLPKNVPAFAMTVHKAQGSGFDSVLLLLPDVQMSVLSKELFYTGITRAKEKIVIFASREIALNLLDKSSYRYSGIPSRLVE